MNRLKFYFILFITALFITACSKDADDSLTHPENQITQDGKIELRSSIGEGDHVLIQSFYEDILTLQSSTLFYDEFYSQHGYFEWTTYQVYNLPNEDPILVMPVTKDRESLSSGVMLYHQNNVGKKFSYISRADMLLAIEQNNPSEIKDIQLDLLVLSDMHRGSGLQEDILINTRDGDEAETPCVGGEFVEFCVRFSGNLADFAQEHNNFQSFLGGELENINFQGIDASEQTQWLEALSWLDGSTVQELLSYDAEEWASNNTLNAPAGFENALLLFNTYVMARLYFFQQTGIGQGSDGVRGQYIQNTSVNSFFECFDVWVACWASYPDFELTGIVINSKPPGTSIPPYHKNYDELMFCEGYEEPHDTGKDNPDSVHPNYEFCKIWMTYLEDCILPNAVLAEGYNGGYAHLIMQWAQFQYYYPDNFMEAIADSEGCGTTTTDVEGNNPPSPISEECRDALNDFEEEYGLDLSISDRKAILFSIDPNSCGEGFDDHAFHIINCVTKTNDYITVLNNTNHCDQQDPPLSMSEDCPKLANILGMVVGEDGTDPHCGMLKDLGSSKGEIQYSWDCDNSNIKPRPDGTFPLGQTKYNLDTKQVKVFLGPELCDKSCAEILSVVIHESIHAKLKSMVLEKLPEPDPFNHAFPTLEDFRKKWLEIRDENFDGIVYEHKIMAEYYTEEYAKAMYDMVGVGNWEDYLYWAYDGLGIDPPLLIGADDWQTHQDSWDAIKTTVDSSLNCE